MLRGGGLSVDSAAAPTPVWFKYGYDRDSNRTYTSALHDPGRSGFHAYDRLNRLTSDQRGILNSAAPPTGLIDEWSAPTEQSWTLDSVGNWSATNHKNSGTTANDMRTHNATNELTGRTVAGEAKRFLVSDTFDDDDTTQWAIADLDGDGTTSGSDDGNWSAASGKLNCTATTTVTGAPDGGTGSIILIDGVKYQDVWITGDASINTNCDNAGIVFGYVDRLNYWVRLYSKAQQKIFIYEISGGTWTQRSSASVAVSTQISMSVRARAGLANNYAATVPAGQVGFFCSDSSDNSFDNFKVRDCAGPFDGDGRWFSDKGEVQVDASDSNVLSSTYAEWESECIPSRGFRGEKYVATFRFKWNTTASPGWLVRWVNPGDWLAVAIYYGDSKARVYKRQDDGEMTTLVTSGTALTLSNGTWYNAKIVVNDDSGTAALQRLRFWVDTDGDGTWSDETTLIDTTTVDDVWSAGQAGLFVGNTFSTAAQDFDDVKIGLDNSSPKDGDFDDAGDSLIVDDNFNSATLSLTYDDNGNLTDDGVFKYAYDAWNRLVAAKTRYASGTTQTTIATYAYDGLFRRTKKVIAANGPEIHPNDGGNATINFYYAGWSIVEMRDGSDRTLSQFVWGTQYIDEPICYDRNTDVGNDNDCLESGGSTRYTYVQDAIYRVVALTDENAAVVERYDYSAYGEPTVLAGASSGSELGNVLGASAVGNPLMHQGLFRDTESGTYQNRMRRFGAGRFTSRDPIGYRGGYNAYEYVHSAPPNWADPRGTQLRTTGRTDYTEGERRPFPPFVPPFPLFPPRPNVAIIYDGADPGNPALNIASGVQFKQFADAQKVDRYPGMGQVNRHDLVNNSLADTLAKANTPDGSIGVLTIVDHGGPGYQECGNGQLTAADIAAICNKLAAGGATINLGGCSVARDKRYMCALAKACPGKNITVCANSTPTNYPSGKARPGGCRICVSTGDPECQ